MASSPAVLLFLVASAIVYQDAAALSNDASDSCVKALAGELHAIRRSLKDLRRNDFNMGMGQMSEDQMQMQMVLDTENDYPNRGTGGPMGSPMGLSGPQGFAGPQGFSGPLGGSPYSSPQHPSYHNMPQSAYPGHVGGYGQPGSPQPPNAMGGYPGGFGFRSQQVGV